MYIRLHLTQSVFSSQLKKNLKFLDRFSKSTGISNGMKIRSVRADLFCADPKTHLMNLVVRFALLETRIKMRKQSNACAVH
jgi:hypothetical protein